MTSSATKSPSSYLKNTFGHLLQRNRARNAKLGVTGDELITLQLKDGKFFAALATASAELDRLGASHDTHARVARCEMIVGLNDRARRSWKSALRFDETAQAYTGLGTVYFEQGNTAGAIIAFQKALNLDQECLEALESLSVAYLHLDDPNTARRYATLALRKNPERLESRLCRARAEIALGNHSLAREDISFVMPRNYKEGEVRRLEVELLIGDGEYESALFLAAQLCEKFPESRDCLQAFRGAFAAFDKSDRQEDLADFLEGLDHFAPLPDARGRTDANAESTQEIDVIIPVHNAWRSVDRCIASVRSSSGPRLGRIILVNDDSDADTRAKLGALASGDGQVVLIDTPQQIGFSRALAIGVAESNTAAFVALNSDTIVTQGWLDKLENALRSSKTVAMVGPLSNNAGWQNYNQVLGAAGGFHSAQTPSARCRDDLSTEVGKRGGRVLVPMHLLHGFCILVDRKAYDACSGVDQVAFPQGYGEFQDLSIRMRAAGYALLATADCIVFHERGASLSDSRRAVLSLMGRKCLYARYSAVNYLCLEMASIRNQELEAHRKAFRPILEAWAI